MKLRKADGLVVLFFVAVYLAKWLSFQYPTIVSQYYSCSVYPYVQKGLQLLFAWYPAPVSYLLLGIYLALSLFLCIKTARSSTRRGFLVAAIRYLAYSTIFFYVSFQLLWGFNYSRNPLIKDLGMQEQAITKEAIEDEIVAVQTQLLTIRSLMDTSVLYQATSMTELQAVLPLVEKSLSKHNLRAINGLQFKVLHPSGVLLHWSTAGIYFPYSGECNIDEGLHPIQVPFTLAHELAHGQGWGDEATCNFLGWLALQDADNKLFKYSAWFDYWRELLSNYRQNYPKDYAKIYQSIDNKLLTDLKNIKLTMNRYADWLPNLRDKIYDNYLKSQGIGEGVKSYNAMIRLVYAYRNNTSLNSRTD